jgi:hypothetical protein
MDTRLGALATSSLSFLEMGSNFIMTSLAKCLKDLEEPMVDQYGDLFYKRGTSNHPLHEALLQSKSYEKCLIYKQDDMQAHEISVDNTNFCRSNRKFHQYYCCKWIIVWVITKITMCLHFYPF